MDTDRRIEFALDEAISVLDATPTALRAFLEELPESWLNFSEEPEAWSPRTVLIHFIHNERTNWLPRIRVFLSDTAVRRFPPFHQLPELSEYADRSVRQLIAEFAALRADSLSRLRDLDLGAADYDLEAEHPVLGPVKLGHLLATWVVHDLNHLHQIEKTMAKRYQNLVGPWRRNLAILDL